MARTLLTSKEIGNVQRNDLDVSTTGEAVIRKVVAGTNITISETGTDAGTGDVTINSPAALTTAAGAVERLTDGEFTTGTDTTRYANAAQIKGVAQTMANKTIALGSNTVSGTTAEFQAALTDGQFLTTIEKGFTIEAPTATEDVPLFRAYRDLTIVHLADAVKGTSPSVTWNIVFDTTADDGSPTSLLASDRTTTSTTGATTTSFNDATIPAGSWVRFKSSAQSGTVTWLHITFAFTQD